MFSYTGGQYAAARNRFAGAGDARRDNSYTGLMSRAFIVLFDDKTQAAGKRRRIEERRDADFNRYVEQHGPFVRYLP